MNSNKIIQVAALAGKIILENGGEIYRVEETISRICKRYHCSEAESYVTPTGIMISIVNKDGHTSSLIKRINARSTNLDKIDKVNMLSRRLEIDMLSIDTLKGELLNIQRQASYKDSINIIFAAIGTGSFAILFNGSYKDLIFAALIGIIIKSLTLFLNKLDINDFFINMIGGFTAALFGYFITDLFHDINRDIIIISSIMLLVPGLIITNAIRDTIAGDLVSGISRIMEAFFIAISIAVGSGLFFKLAEILGGVI